MEGIEVRETREAPSQAPVPPKKKFTLSKKGKKWLRRLLIAAAAVAAVYFFFLRPAGQKGSQLMSSMYLTETAVKQDLTVSVSGSGIVTPIDSYRVGAMAMGEVLEAPFEEGDWVEKGDLLYSIDAGDAETALQQAQLGVQQARQSQRQAQLRLDELKDTYRCTAGDAGVIQQVFVEEGDTVGVGSPIAELLDNSTMILTVPFHAADAGQLFPGQTALVTLEGTMETLTGTVDTVAASTQPGPGGTAVRSVEIRVANPGALSAASRASAQAGGVTCAASGSFAESLRKTVVSDRSGKVTHLAVDVNDTVRPGDLLVTLGSAASDRDLENASIAVENAALSVRNAQLSLQRAQDALDNYRITAPISGTVIEKNFKAGDKIDSDSLSSVGGSLAVLYDMSTLTFKMNINDLDINKLELGQPVTVTAEALKGQSFPAHVDKISINGMTAGGFTTYPVTIRLDGSGTELVEQGLKPGMSISAEILVEEAGQVLCLPIDAVGRGDVVLVAGEGALDDRGRLTDPSRLEEHPVVLGRNGKDMVEIVSGLSEGDVVYIHNPSSNMMSAMMGMGG